MNERIHTSEPSNHREKMVFRALSPVGMPREPERKRCSLSYIGLAGKTSDRGGESNAG
jgi:hypothetical protein